MEQPSSTPATPGVPFALALGWLGMALAIGMPAGAFSEILLEFGSGAAYSAWAIAAFPLGVAFGVVVFSRTPGASQPRMILLGLAVFATAAFSSAASLTLPLLIAMRLVAGIGASLAARAFFEHTRRGPGSDTARGVAVATWAVGLGLGLIAGGLLADTWQLAFAMPGVAALAGLAAGWRTLAKPSTESPHSSNDEPVASSHQSATLLSLAMTSGAFSGIFFALPMLLTAFHSRRSTDAAMDLLPAAGGLLLAGIVAVYLAAKTGPRIPSITGSWILLAAALTFHFTGVDWSTSNTALLGAALSLGFALSFAGLVWSAAINTRSSRGLTWPVLATQVGTAAGIVAAYTLIDLRESAESPIDTLFTGTAIPFSDAFLVSVAMAAVTFFVAVLQPPARKIVVSEPEPVMAPRPRPIGPSTWAVKPRAKPNAQGR